MYFQILSIFPELFSQFRELGLLGRACADGLVQIDITQLRDYAVNTHGQIDDSPYGGGSGMVLRPDAAVAAIEAAKLRAPQAKVVLFTPRGKPLTQAKIHKLLDDSNAGKSEFILLCCRYEGVDQRVVDNFVDEEISLGDYIVQGGEVAAMAFIEALTRLLPGVLGNPDSVVEESFEQGLLEYPQYTKPSEYRGLTVPPVLLSGNHKEIHNWRRERAVADTMFRRPELITTGALPACELNIALVHYPALNKRGEVVASSITNLDLHDIARSARTFGIKNYYVVHPTKTLRRLSEKICEHWEIGYGASYNPNRSEALRTITLVPDLNDVYTDIEIRTGKSAKIITTSARPSARAKTFCDMRELIYQSTEPYLILFGTGWGLTDEILEQAHYHLAPICGFTEYNHLSVRSAAAIIFDRLFATRYRT